MPNSTTIDYGPLTGLIGTWKGDKGVDKAPEPAGEEKSLYYETLLFEDIGDVCNADQQSLAVLRYHQVVSRKSNDEVFHNETGYWSWDSKTDIITHSLTIPRGVCVLAGGTAKTKDSEIEIEVAATLGDPDWGIIQSPFMRDNASTTGFHHKISISGNNLSYVETITLDIYGRTFEHSDRNRLQRC